MSIKTPNICLKENFSIGGMHDTRTLEQGTFVKPIDYGYLPKHVKEDERWRFFNADTHVFCYTRWGIVPIPRNLLIER